MVNGGRIENQYINGDMVKRTVKLELNSERRVKRADILGSLDKVDGLDLSQVAALYQKGENSNVYYVELQTQDQTDCLVRAGKCSGSYFNAAVSPMTAQTVKIRIHWLPTYIRESFCRVVLGQFGKVLTYDEDVYTDRGVRTKTGSRTVMLQCSEAQKRDLPHIIKFDDGICMLLVVPGRLPYCLKCSTIGHIRKDCPKGRGLTGLKTYARVVRQSSDVEDDSSQAENVPSDESNPSENTDVPSASTSDRVETPPGAAVPQQKPNKEGTKRALDHDKNENVEQWSTVEPRKVAKVKKGNMTAKETVRSSARPDIPSNNTESAFAPAEDTDDEMDLSSPSPALTIDLQGAEGNS